MKPSEIENGQVVYVGRKKIVGTKKSSTAPVSSDPNPASDKESGKSTKKG
jgi:hypothetical protein